MKPLHLLTILFFFRCFSSDAITYTWNVASGDWSLNTNWEPNGVPGVDDHVIINNGGTVTLDVPATIASMYMNGGTLSGSNTFSISGDLALDFGTFGSTGTVTVGGALTWGGTATIGGSGTMTVTGTATITNTITLDGRTLTLNGNGTISGVINAYNNANLVINGTLACNTFGNSAWGGTGGIITLNGTLIRNGSGYVAFDSYSFQNTGTITLNQGSMYMGLYNHNGTHTGATFNIVSAGSYLVPTGGNHTFTGCTFTGNGIFGSGGPANITTFTGNTVANTLGMAASGTFTLGQNLNIEHWEQYAGGDVNGTSDITISGNFLQSGGTFSPNGNVTLNGNLDWSGGTIGGTGTMTVAGPTTITNSPTLTTRALTLNGGGTWSPPVSSTAFYTNDNANNIVPTGQTLIITTTGNCEFSSTSGAGVFTLHGTLGKNGPGWVVFARQSFQNDGTVNVNQGEVYVGAFGESSSHASNGATFDLASSTLFATHGGTHDFTNCNINGNGSFGATGTGAIGTFSGNVLAPGLSPGILLTIGNFVPNLSSNIFNVELAGYGGPGVPTGHDQLQANNTVTLGGTLNISFLGGFTPAINDFFIIITSTGGFTGNFTTINHPGNNPNAWQIDVTTNPNQVRLVLAQALPLELLDFQIFAEGEKNQLTWRSASETDFSHYEIERSADARNWSKLGMVSGAGNSTEEHSYQFTDRQPLPLGYYRLRMVDMNGSEEFSKVVTVERQGRTGTVRISPNPFSDKMEISLNVNETATAYFSLIDMAGRIVWQSASDMEKGRNRLLFELLLLPQGVYLLHVQTPGQMMSERVVKM